MADEITDIEYSLNGGPPQSSGQTDFPFAVAAVNETEYGVRVRTRNVHGPSPWSNEVFATPTALALPKPVIVSSSRHGANVHIVWEYIPGKATIEQATPTHEGAQISASVECTGYTAITDWEYQVDGGIWQSSGSSSVFFISGLENDVAVDVRVRAVNARGVGFASDVVSVTPEEPDTALATGGDEVYEITQGGDTYRVHEFHEGGVLTVINSGEYEYLLAGGGGGGGHSRGGGGGGGGVLEGDVVLTPGTYPITIGTGGRGSEGIEDTAENGGNSTFNGLTAHGGGFGGTYRTELSGNGGCGGGGSQQGPGGNGILGQGSDGQDSTNYYGRPGGGAGNPGSTAFTQNGRMSSITGSAVEYARGGDANTADGGAKPGNTGHGGDGDGSYTAGQAGGSGIVIVRYKI